MLIQLYFFQCELACRWHNGARPAMPIGRQRCQSDDIRTLYYKRTLHSRFLHYFVPHLSSGILPPTDYGTTIKSLHTRDVPNLALQTASPQIALEETNLPKSYRSTLSQLRIFCNSLHSYSKRIGLVPSPLCPSCDLMPHTTVHVFSCSSRPTPLT